MGGGTRTGTGAGVTTTGAGTGIPKLIPKRTPAFTVVMPTAARARIAIVFFIMSNHSTRWLSRPSLQVDYSFVRQERGHALQKNDGICDEVRAGSFL